MQPCNLANLQDFQISHIQMEVYPPPPRTLQTQFQPIWAKNEELVQLMEFFIRFFYEIWPLLWKNDPEKWKYIFFVQDEHSNQLKPLDVCMVDYNSFGNFLAKPWSILAFLSLKYPKNHQF